MNRRLLLLITLSLGLLAGIVICRLTISDAAQGIAGVSRPSLALEGRVTDAAQLLGDLAESKLTDRLQQLERKTGHQLVVVTVPSLNGQDIKEFTTHLANAWGIGRAKANDGVMLLVAPNERSLRISVGYGLENQLTDFECSQIIKEDMLPRLAVGDFEAGIDAGVDAIIKRLR